MDALIQLITRQETIRMLKQQTRSGTGVGRLGPETVVHENNLRFHL